MRRPLAEELSVAPRRGPVRESRAGWDMIFGIAISVSALDSALHSFCASQFHEKEGVGGVFFGQGSGRGPGEAQRARRRSGGVRMYFSIVLRRGEIPGKREDPERCGGGEATLTRSASAWSFSRQQWRLGPEQKPAGLAPNPRSTNRNRSSCLASCEINHLPTCLCGIATD